MSSNMGMGSRSTAASEGIAALTAERDALRVRVQEPECDQQWKVACKGRTDTRCAYLSRCDVLCNKCGKLHNGGIPESMVLVPREPTEVMVRAACNSRDADPEDGVIRSEVYYTYKAMITAAEAK